MVVGRPKPYVENPNFKPSLTAQRGTFVTDGGSGVPINDYDNIVDVFKEPVTPRESGLVPDEVPSSGVGDHGLLTGTLDTAGVDGAGSQPTPVVAGPAEPPTSIGGSPIIGVGTDSAETQGTVDTTGTDMPTTPSVKTPAVPEPEPEDEPDEPGVADEPDEQEEQEGSADGSTPAPEPEPVVQAEPEPPSFTPVGRTVDAVNEYLATADAEERARVIAIERENKARVGIVDGPHAS